MEQTLQLAVDEGQADALRELFERFPNCHAQYWAIVDFNLPSSEERLFIFDIVDKSFKKFLVAHGKNSGEKYATVFSNTVGSNCSSLGIYSIVGAYSGKHGRSLRIQGLDQSNSNAHARDIVIHQADYVVPNFQGTGRAGRSEGCFAVNPADISEVIDSLVEGSYLNAWHF